MTKKHSDDPSDPRPPSKEPGDGSDRTFATLRSRLSVYGLENRESELRDLLVETGEMVHLTRTEPELQPHSVTLRPDSSQQLKQWIGIPDDVVEHASTRRDRTNAVEERATDPCASFIPQPPIDRANHEMQTNLYKYLFENSSRWHDSHLSAIKAYIEQASIHLNAFVLRDIYVSKRSRLIVDADTQVLVARYIYVEETGLIEMRSAFSKIDCAGMRTIGRFRTGTDIIKSQNPLFGASRTE